MNQETHEVEKKRMNLKGRVILILAIGVGTILYGQILRALGGELPFVDSLSTVASIAAMIISVWMFMEQWAIWIVVDVVTVAMWAWAFAHGNESIATLIMWVVYLVNAIIMYVKWSGEANENAV